MNVWIAAACSSRGAPAELVRRWRDAAFEVVASESLLSELVRALTYAKVRTRVTTSEASALISLLRSRAEIVPDADPVGPGSRDPADDYLLGLAQSAGALLVTGDEDLLALRDLPIGSPSAFLRRLEDRSERQ